jgi:hypothetical protein
MRTLLVGRTMAKIIDVVEENGRYFFKVQARYGDDDDFNKTIAALKEEFHYTERGWNPETKEWNVAATEENEERLAEIFENAEMVFLGIHSQMRMF